MSPRFSTRGKMDTPKLPSDCIEEILKSLDKDNDRTSLYSWTLVNRSWCKIAISLLWGHPFTDMKFDGDDHETGRLLIRTYISCLSDDKRQILIDEGHNLKVTKTLFDYPSYLKELHIGHVQASIGHWWEKSTDYMLKQKAQFQTVVSLILEMLFNKCNGLKKLDCELQQFYYRSADFISFAGTQKAISRLNELRIDCSSVDQGHLFELLTMIIKDSQYINHIVITPLHDSPLAQQIPRLIESQHNLTSFKMNSTLVGSFDPSRSASIFSSLTSQLNSLTILDFRKIYIDGNSLDILIKCLNLKSLKFVNCYQEQDITVSESSCKTSSHLKINRLTLNSEISRKTFLSSKTCTTIIMMSKNHLKELAIDFSTPELLQFIHTQLSNLTSLAIRTIPPLHQLEWISNSNTLSHLALSDVDVNSCLFSITICQQIGRLLPINLKHLQLESRFNIAPESLTGLLERSVARLEILSLDVEKFDDTLLEVVGDYARDTGKHLKELRICKDTRIEFDHNLCKKLLNDIPSINLNYEDPWPILIEFWIFHTNTPVPDMSENASTEDRLRALIIVVNGQGRFIT
ncbi:7346_t:CDS:2 [Funneliformis geosporum]|nr:7346_t:CDS:2 [Funneliformis geosporum]